MLSMQEPQIQSVPFRIVLNESGAFDANVNCPVCGCTEVHLGNVVIEQGQVATVVSREESRTLPTDRHKTKGGSQVSLAMYCEAGDWWFYKFKFHKGSTGAEMYVGNDDENLPPELWRD